MAFHGLDKLEQDAPDVPTGGWVRLRDDVPVTVTVQEYIGQVESKKFEGKFSYRFRVEEAGQPRFLDCNHRLMRELQHLAHDINDAFTVKILQTKGVESITRPDGSTSKQLVNQYEVVRLNGTATPIKTRAEEPPEWDEVPDDV
jgi:hypothetical protein